MPLGSCGSAEEMHKLFAGVSWLPPFYPPGFNRVPLLVLPHAAVGGHLPAPDFDVSQLLVAHELVDHRDRHAEFTGRIFYVHLTITVTSQFCVVVSRTGSSAMRPPIPFTASCASGCGTTIPCLPVFTPDPPTIENK